MSDNPPCVLAADGYCPRHRVAHLGHLRGLALGTDGRCQRYRKSWDARVAQGLPAHGTAAPFRWGRLRQAGGLLKALARTLGRLLTRRRVRVPRRVYRQRLAACRACPLWTGSRCGLCGCTELKLHLPDQQCPLAPPRWGPWEKGT